MSEVSAKRVIQNFFRDNESELLSGINHYGVQRTFSHITRSTLTPPTGYYFVAIHVDNKEFRKKLDPANDLFDIPKTWFYRLTVSILDYVGAVAGETELYEAMNDDFNLITDRIIDLLEKKYNEQTYFTDNLSRFRLFSDTDITCENSEIYWPEAESFAAYLISEIKFDLEEC
jgi:hypothetical protein